MNLTPNPSPSNGEGSENPEPVARFEPSWKSLPQTWSMLKEPAREHRHAPTVAEARLWFELRAGKVEGLRFRRQHSVGPYILDFYCASAQLVVEVDGPIHETQQDQDAARTEFLEAKGLKVVRFTNRQVLESPTTVVETIKRVIASSPLR